MCPAVVFRYAVNEELCVEGVKMLFEYLLCKFVCVARFMYISSL